MYYITSSITLCTPHTLINLSSSSFFFLFLLLLQFFSFYQPSSLSSLSSIVLFLYFYISSSSSSSFSSFSFSSSYNHISLSSFQIRENFQLLFNQSNIRVVRLPSNSSVIWTISPPSRERLLNTVTRTLSQNISSMEMMFSWSFTRSLCLSVCLCVCTCMYVQYVYSMYVHLCLLCMSVCV